MAAKKKGKRTLVSYKDIQIAYLMEGLDGVKKLWESGNASKATIRRAVKLLQDTNGSSADLERWVADNIGAMKSPSLRNLQSTAPFAHAGQQKTLREVLDHYNDAPDAMIGHNEAKPLGLWPWQVSDLEAFLRALEAPIAADARWLAPPDREPR